jgi:hypothetical protein
MRCPVCRADVQEGPNCRRCRVDLSPLFDLESQRQRALAAAYLCLQQHRPRQALVIAEGIHALRADEGSQRVRALARLLCRDFASAWHIYRSRIGAPGV